MAQKEVDIDEETFSCPICLDLLRDPVTIPCGHNYCLSCIQAHWIGADDCGIYSCPQCRKGFTPRPELQKNTLLAAVVHKLKKEDQCYAGAEDVACDFCTGRKLKARKSCLVCQVSYCDTHLQPHFQSPAFANHKLVDASQNLQEIICPQHSKLMDMFCRSDRQCICSSCSVDKHKGHDIVSAAEERGERQEELRESWRNVQRRIQDREEDVKVLRREAKDVGCAAEEAVKQSQDAFRQMIRLMEKKSSEVTQQIRSQEAAEVRRVAEFQKTLEQEIAELRSTEAELQKLLDTEDHCSFLRKYPSVSQLGGSTYAPRIEIHPRRYFEEVTAAVAEFSKKMQGLLSDAWANISSARTDLLLSEPRTRAEFLRYARDITLDPNTANTQLLISAGNKEATMTWENYSYAAHPGRFQNRCQVLSVESLTERCYWEVKVGRRGVHVALAYKTISREGDESRFGHNDKSWSLDCDGQSYTFWHDSVHTALSGPWSSVVGVFLDHRAGVLSFYSVSQTMTLLHRVQTTFTQPLHAGLWLYCVDAPAEFLKIQ